MVVGVFVKLLNKFLFVVLSELNVPFLIRFIAVNTLKEQYIFLLIFRHLINKMKDIENFLD